MLQKSHLGKTKEKLKNEEPIDLVYTTMDDSYLKKDETYLNNSNDVSSEKYVWLSTLPNIIEMSSTFMKQHLFSLPYQQSLQNIEESTLLRFLCFSGGFALVISNILSLLDFLRIFTGPLMYVLHIYQAFFGCVIMILEAHEYSFLHHLKPWMLQWFRFLTVPAGKGAFYLFVGSLGVALWMSNFLVFLIGVYMVCMGITLISFYLHRRSVLKQQSKAQNLLFTSINNEANLITHCKTDDTLLYNSSTNDDQTTNSTYYVPKSHKWMSTSLEDDLKSNDTSDLSTQHEQDDKTFKETQDMKIYSYKMTNHQYKHSDTSSDFYTPFQTALPKISSHLHKQDDKVFSFQSQHYKNCT